MAAMACVTGTGANVLASLFPCAIRQAKMVFFLRRAVNNMEAEVRRLKDLRNGINMELTQEQRSPKPIVKSWLEKVESVIQRSEAITKEYEQRCPNIFCRYKINKHISVWLKDVAKIHQEKQSDLPQSEGYSEITPPSQIPIRIPESGFIGNIIQSAQSKLMRWLMDDSSNIEIIGVYGMGGVGKTSLLQAINNNPQIKKSFDLIIWVTISKDYDVLDLQGYIAERLRLKHFPDKSDSLGRESMLCSYLSKKKYLLLLDDMWRSLELQSLGVSLNDRSCKIVITTRYKTVCDCMNAKELIKIDPLPLKESWELFCSRAFNRNNGVVPLEVEDVAKKISRECNGLPLAIIVIAAAMRRYEYRHEWELALDHMQNIEETFYEIHHEIEKHLLQPLTWSYNDLPSCLKSCFVYFAAYPEDKPISWDKLTEFWIAEGLVKGGRESYLPDTAQSFMRELSDRCLIEVTNIDIFGRIVLVKIHDVLRDLAILIARKEHHCFFKAGPSLRDFPVVGESEGWLRMSLMCSSLRSVPSTCPCPSILVLTLSWCSHLKEIPGSFLQGLPLLRVLDLSHTGIALLPSCMTDLKHLTSLQLGHTKIRELPETIGNLSKLQFLNVAECEHLRCLPTSIGNLKYLVGLDIEDCGQISIIPRVISELVSLQRLKMIGSIALEFDAPDDSMGRRSYLCLKDLQSLCVLRELSVNVKSSVREGAMVNWSKMRNMCMDFNNANEVIFPPDMKAMKDELECLTLWDCNVEKFPSWVSEFQKLSGLYLFNCSKMEEVPAELYELPNLRGFLLHGCIMLKELDLGRQGLCFPKLQKLYLENLELLESLVVVGCESNGGILGEGALLMLKSFQVLRCEKLRMLPLGFDKLRCLQEIRGNQIWWDAMEWKNIAMKTTLKAKFTKF